jgi:hypothetical protein
MLADLRTGGFAHGVILGGDRTEICEVTTSRSGIAAAAGCCAEDRRYRTRRGGTCLAEQTRIQMPKDELVDMVAA